MQARFHTGVSKSNVVFVFGVKQPGCWMSWPNPAEYFVITLSASCVNFYGQAEVMDMENKTQVTPITVWLWRTLCPGIRVAALCLINPPKHNSKLKESTHANSTR